MEILVTPKRAKAGKDPENSIWTCKFAGSKVKATKPVTVTLVLLPLMFLVLTIGIQDYAVPLGIVWLLCSVACLVWGICIVRTQRHAGRLCIVCGIVNLLLVFLPALLPAHRIVSHL